MPLLAPCNVPHPYSIKHIIAEHHDHICYLGVDNSTGDEVEITVANGDYGKAKLQHDVAMRQVIGKSVGFPTLYHASPTLRVDEVHGPSLEDLIRFCGGRVSKGTTLHAIAQMLSRLRCLADTGVVHNNISPATIRIGVGNREGVFHLVDFQQAADFVEKALPHNDLQALTNLANQLLRTGQGADGLESAVMSPGGEDLDVSNLLSTMLAMAQAQNRPIGYACLQSQLKSILQRPGIWATARDWMQKRNQDPDEERYTVLHTSANVPVMTLFAPEVKDSASSTLVGGISAEAWMKSVMEISLIALNVETEVSQLSLDLPSSKSAIGWTTMPEYDRFKSLYTLQNLIVYAFQDFFLAFTYPVIAPGPTRVQTLMIGEMVCRLKSSSSKVFSALPDHEPCGKAARLHTMRILQSVEEMRPGYLKNPVHGLEMFSI